LQFVGKAIFGWGKQIFTYNNCGGKPIIYATKDWFCFIQKMHCIEKNNTNIVVAAAI
jgi:hypothetical protein